MTTLQEVVAVVGSDPLLTCDRCTAVARFLITTNCTCGRAVDEAACTVHEEQFLKGLHSLVKRGEIACVACDAALAPPYMRILGLPQ